MKRVLVLAFVCAFAPHLFATGEPEAASSKITLRFWTGIGTVTPDATFEPAAALYKRLFADFEKDNPSIKVETQVLPGGTEALQKVLAAAAAKDLPDVGGMDGFWLARLKEQNIIQPLDAFWPTADQADFPPDVMKALTFEGKPYGVWFYTAVRGIMYRRDILKQETGLSELPTDRVEFIAAMKKLAKPNRWGIVAATNNAETTTLHLLPLFWAYGGVLADSTGKPVFQEGANRQALKRVYQWYYDMANVYKIMPAQAIPEGDMLNYFYADQAVGVMVTSSTLTTVKKNRPDLYEKIGFANYPIEKGLRAVPHLVGWTYCLMTDKKDRQPAAWKFIERMTSPATLRESNETNGHIPVRKSVAEASTFFKTDPVFKDVLAINFGGPVQARPPVATYPVISNAIATQMEAVLAGKMTPDQAIDEAAKVSMADWQRIQR